MAESLELDKKNSVTNWADGIASEMNNVRVDFDVLPDRHNAPIRHQFLKCHMIFDVNMVDFRLKAQYVAVGNMKNAPPTITYASVVSRDTVRLALTISNLNGLQVKAADIMNAYVTDPITENIWTVLGPEFGDDSRKKAYIVRALYRLNSSSAAFRNHLADCMHHMGYKSCTADPDLWMNPEVIPSDGFEYYSYILCYVDDILCIHHDYMAVLNKLDNYFKLNPGSTGDPDMYLGVKLWRMKLINVVVAWVMIPSKYVREAANNCAKHVKDNFPGKYTCPARAENPFVIGYEAVINMSESLDLAKASYFQSIIGIMSWMVKIGRIDIVTEVSLLSSHLAYPRVGHIEAALCLMDNLKQKHNSRLVFDTTFTKCFESIFKDCYWKDFYGDAKKAIPLNAPKPCGKDINLWVKVDSNQGKYKETRR